MIDYSRGVFYSLICMLFLCFLIEERFQILFFASALSAHLDFSFSYSYDIVTYCYSMENKKINTDACFYEMKCQFF